MTSSTPSDSENSRRPISSREPFIRWLQVWLTCLAFYYPVFWSSQFVVRALPGLIRVGFLGYRLKYFHVSKFGATAISVPVHIVSRSYLGTPGIDAYPLSVLVPLTLVLIALLIGLVRRFRVIAGLIIAMVGLVGLLPWFARIFFLKQIELKILLGSVFFFAVLCVGLRWTLSGWNASSYWERVRNLVAGFVLPLTGLGALHFFRFSSALSWPVGPSLVASAIVCVRPPRKHSRDSQWSGWKPVGVGLATSLLLAAGIPRAQGAIERAQRARDQAAMATYPKIGSDLPYRKIFFQKGVNFTAEFPAVYASQEARRMLKKLPKYGINAIALVPYGWTRTNPPEVRLHSGPRSWESDEGLEELTRVAHSLGMKVMLKPGMWSSRGSAGNLDFPNVKEQKEWFVQYQRFLDHYARLATQIHADIFCVGGEFVKLSQDQAEWRKLIVRVRGLYPGPLVYAADFGPEFESIKFWDALDYIGLQEYYPLPDNLSTKAIVQKVEAVQQKFHRPVIFTEAGFASSKGANRQPWNDDESHQVSLEEQAHCYDAIFRAFYNQPWFEGVYWWKIGTNGFGGPKDSSLTPWGKPAMAIIRHWYLHGGR